MQSPIDYSKLISHNFRARKDVILSLSEPIRGRDGSDITSIFVPKNTDVTIGILAINNDPTIWGEDAHVWNPDRWLRPLPDTVTEARVPGIYANL